MHQMYGGGRCRTQVRLRGTNKKIFGGAEKTGGHQTWPRDFHRCHKEAFTNVAYREEQIRDYLRFLLIGRANLIVAFKGVCHHTNDQKVDMDAVEEFLSADSNNYWQQSVLHGSRWIYT